MAMVSMRPAEAYECRPALPALRHVLNRTLVRRWGARMWARTAGRIFPGVGDKWKILPVSIKFSNNI
jgi:hypothetical protein